MKCFVSLVVVVVGFDLNWPVNWRTRTTHAPVVWWLTVCLLRLGTRAWSLVWELGSYMSRGSWVPMQQLLIPSATITETCARALPVPAAREATAARSQHTTASSFALLAAARESPCEQRTPMQPKIHTYYLKKEEKYTSCYFWCHPCLCPCCPGVQHMSDSDQKYLINQSGLGNIICNLKVFNAETVLGPVLWVWYGITVRF